ncbi:MAG: hypothetical protein IJU60_05955 [Acholeplasmatales bacterium]|nr:hypothetical protein [Acholeplasmatales bacterium]
MLVVVIIVSILIFAGLVVGGFFFLRHFFTKKYGPLGAERAYNVVFPDGEPEETSKEVEISEEDVVGSVKVEGIQDLSVYQQPRQYVADDEVVYYEEAPQGPVMVSRLSHIDTIMLMKDNGESVNYEITKNNEEVLEEIMKLIEENDLDPKPVPVVEPEDEELDDLDELDDLEDDEESSEETKVEAEPEPEVQTEASVTSEEPKEEPLETTDADTSDEEDNTTSEEEKFEMPVIEDESFHEAEENQGPAEEETKAEEAPKPVLSVKTKKRTPRKTNKRNYEISDMGIEYAKNINIESELEGVEVVGIVFNNKGSVHYYRPNGYDLKVGDVVAVKDSAGQRRVVPIVVPNILIDPSKLTDQARQIEQVVYFNN